MRLLLKRLVPALCAMAWGCIGTYDPFSDLDNAGIWIEYASLSDGDTLALFSAETLQVRVRLKEHTDSVSFHAPANRFWSGGDTTLAASRYPFEPFVLLVSLTDTGVQQITLSAHVKGGRVATRPLTVYGRLPLHQPPVEGFFGDTLTLSTPPLGDNDVTYHWSFGGATTISSPNATVRTVVTAASVSGRGELWASGGGADSPRLPFTFSLNDTTPPLITCLSPYCYGDTVVTGDTIFDFALRITDRGVARVDSVSINGGPFTFVSGAEYHRIFPAMHLHTPANPLQATVFALDHFAFGNTITRTFTLMFSDTLTQGAPYRLTVAAPAHPQGFSTTADYTLAGSITAVGPLPATVLLTTQGTIDTRVQTLQLDSVVTPWMQAIGLRDSITTLSITLTNEHGTDTFAVVQRTITRIPEGTDTTGPVIAELLIDASPANGYYSRRSLVLVRTRVFDEASAVGRVTINAVPAIAEGEGWFAGNLTLQHTREGNPVTVVAHDEHGNTTEATALAYFNRPGVFLWRPASRYLVADSLYRDSVAGVDPDGDTLTFDLFAGPEGVTVTEEGGIYWSPTAGDSGRHSITVRMFDGYEPSYVTWQVHVSAAHNPTTPLRFATTAEEFPRFVEALRDTVAILLQAAPGTGVAPLRFSAWRVGADSALMLNAADPWFIWVPDRTDSGWQQLLITIRDDFGGRDTIYPRVFVTFANSPCSLSVSHNVPLRPDGSLDLAARGTRAELLVRIHDPDPPITERHAISVHLGGVMTFIDSARTDTFLIELDPARLRPLDTLTITVRDRGGATDTLVLYLFNTPHADLSLEQGDRWGDIPEMPVFRAQQVHTHPQPPIAPQRRAGYRICQSVKKPDTLPRKPYTFCGNAHEPPNQPHRAPS